MWPLLGGILGLAAGIWAATRGVGRIAWFAIVFTGKQPKGLQDAIELGTAYGARGGAYFFLLTEDWPPFSIKDDTTPASPAEPAAAPPPPPPAV